MRKKHQISLVTVKVHRSCNSSYKLDEQYFTQCLMPFLKGSYTGQPLYDKSIRDYNTDPRRRVLIDQIMASAKDNVRGVILPSGKFWYDVQLDRIHSVVKKIVRGLHFTDLDEIIPAEMNMVIDIVFPGNEPPQHFLMVRDMVPDHEARGHHQGIFAYRYYRASEFHYWALLLWDRVIITSIYKIEADGADGGT